jgi:hypothetical protein
MKKVVLLAFLCLPFCLYTNGQILSTASQEEAYKEETLNVKKESTSFVGIMAKGGTVSQSFVGYDFDKGNTMQVYLVYGGPISSNPETHWYMSSGLGFEYYGGSYPWYDDDENITKKNIAMIGLCTIPLKLRYVFNPLSTGGKVYLDGGLDFCPIVFGIPIISEDTGSIGVKIGFEASLGFEIKHWGINAGAYYGITGAWNTKKATYTEIKEGKGTKISGLYASLYYLF